MTLHPSEQVIFGVCQDLWDGDNVCIIAYFDSEELANAEVQRQLNLHDWHKSEDYWIQSIYLQNAAGVAMRQEIDLAIADSAE